MDLEQIIHEKPHLADVLRLYEKLRAYEGYVASLGIPLAPDSVGYPPESVEKTLEGFTTLFDLPDAAVKPLVEAMKTSALDLSRLPLGEVPSFSLPYHEEELKSVLFLMGRPFFRKMKELNPLDDTEWAEGRCPVCNARPAMASPFSESTRRLYCSFCTTSGFYSASTCPFCATPHSAGTEILSSEQEQGYKVELCETCRSYLKSIEQRKLNDVGFDVADLVSLPLDIVAQNRGFARGTPNPIGLIRTT